MGFRSLCLAITALVIVSTVSEPLDKLENRLLGATEVTEENFTSVIRNGKVVPGETKIVGGQNAHPGAFTSMVALQFRDPEGVEAPYLVGAGTLISKRTVLTAGDVIYTVTNATDLTKLNKYLHGRVGSNKWKEGGQLIEFSRGVSHPNYNNETFKYDAGLLFTSAPVMFSSTVRPIKIDFDYVGANVRVIVAGWGTVRADKPDDSSDTLRQLSMSTVDGEKCVPKVAAAAVEYNWIYPPVDPKVEICALKSKGHGTCTGDGGSALIRLDRGTVIGHATWGVPCATGAPDVFARLSAMKDWLQKTIKK